MRTAPAVKYLTVEQYLAMEDAADDKHEYIGGEVYAMAGASFPHNQIASNALGSVWQFLQDKSCDIYGSDLKVHVKTASGFVYPDLTIVCDGPQFLENRTDIVINPSVIIEVTSPDTQGYDHGKKFMLYRQMPTLREYILISSMEVLVEKFVREESGAWTLTEYKEMNKQFFIDTIGYQTTLAKLYRKVVFEVENDNQTGLQNEKE